MIFVCSVSPLLRLLISEYYWDAVIKENVVGTLILASRSLEILAFFQQMVEIVKF